MFDAALNVTLHDIITLSFNYTLHQEPEAAHQTVSLSPRDAYTSGLLQTLGMDYRSGIDIGDSVSPDFLQLLFISEEEFDLSSLTERFRGFYISEIVHPTETIVILRYSGRTSALFAMLDIPLQNDSAPANPLFGSDIQDSEVMVDILRRAEIYLAIEYNAEKGLPIALRMSLEFSHLGVSYQYELAGLFIFS
jgi:hypothetical protein